MINCVVAPLDHKWDVPADDVNVTVPPEQKVIGPPAVTVGAAGVNGDVNDPFNVFDTHPPLVKVIV